MWLQTNVRFTFRHPRNLCVVQHNIRQISYHIVSYRSP